MDEPSIYSDDILPELLNNIGCTLLLKQEYKDIEKYLNEAKNILKEELKKMENKYKNKENEENIDKNDKKKILRFRALKISVDFNLALYYDSQAQFDHSHFLYKKIIAENPYFVEAYIKLSELYKLRGNKSKAESYIKQAIDKHYKLIQDDRKTQKKEEENKKDNEINDISKQKINDKMEIEKEEEKNETKKEEKGKEGETEQKKEEKTEQKKMHRLITVMGKPVNPMLIQACYLYENNKEYEAIAVLNKILMEFKPYDPYTLTFLANIYYSMAIDTRTKAIDKEKMKKAIELYFRALENDKFNSLAAIGLSNCLCEFNYVDKAIDIYRSIMETLPNDHNALINSSFIYMDDKKYEKAYILLHKVLMTLFHGNNSKVENLLTKCCIEMKDFKAANQHIKNLIMKYPDNLEYQYNYGFLLYSQFEDIINKSTRKYSDTQKAIKLVSRALKIFEELYKTKREDRNIKIIQKNEFYYKCEDMLNICKVNLTKANEISERDLENEENMKKKNEEDFNEYKKKIEEQKEQKEKGEKMKIKEIGEQDVRIKEENMELMERINQKNLEIQMEKMREKEKKGKKRGKKKGKTYSEDEYENQNLELEEKEYEESFNENEAEDKEKKDENENENEINSDYFDEEQEKKKEKPKKRLLLKKRKIREDEYDELDDKNEQENNEKENNQEEINNEEPNKDEQNNDEQNNDEIVEPQEENEDNKDDDKQNNVENENEENNNNANANKNIIEDE